MNTLIPFGKYKGQPVEVLSNDPEYVEWLRQQDWFVSKYQQINNIVINNFNEPAETPEHNKLVAKFTEDKYLIAFMSRYVGASKESCKKIDMMHTKCYRVFEHHLGSDIYARVDFALLNDKEIKEFEARIECKPIISDDFPAIIRQCKSQKTHVVVYGEFTAKGSTLEQVKVMFGHISLISTDEIDQYYSYL